MQYVVLFEDNPDADPEIRNAHMQDHLGFLEAAGNVGAAGPLTTRDGAAAGGIWLVEAEDAAAVDALVKRDPFWPTGLRKSVQVLAWTQVFADGQRKFGL
ncbi:MAG: YciI family protein [Alphaproteobacteria bacterium]